MNSAVPKYRVLKWQSIAKIYTYMGRDVYVAAYVSAYVSWHIVKTLTSVYCFEAEINTDFWEERKLKSQALTHIEMDGL